MLSSRSEAFPDLALSRGYQSCGSCHVADSGGGALTPYGRMASEEMLSTWANEGEGNPGHVNYKIPEWLIIGGDFRAVYFGSEDQENTFIPMQKDVEAGFKYDILTVVGSYGLYDDRSLESRTRYLLLRPVEYIAFKMGKFAPSYGLRFADHTSYNRQPLGLGENSEVYGNELALKSKYGELFLTAIDRTKSETGKFLIDPGYAVRVSVFPTKGSVAGASWWRQENSQEVKCGGFFEAAYRGWFIGADINEVWGPDAALADLYGYSRVSYQLYRGLNLIYENNYSKANFVSSRQNSIGFSFYPRPHIELYGRLLQLDGKKGFALLAHYYL